MRFSTRLLACACLSGLASGCATFGTNVEGDFTCRAPKGGCAPTHVIDAKATGNRSAEVLTQSDVRQRSGVVDADTARTAERTVSGTSKNFRSTKTFLPCPTSQRNRSK